MKVYLLFLMWKHVQLTANQKCADIYDNDTKLHKLINPMSFL